MFFFLGGGGGGGGGPMCSSLCLQVIFQVL